jgi:hypothetical protein
VIEAESTTLKTTPTWSGPNLTRWPDSKMSKNRYSNRSRKTLQNKRRSFTPSSSTERQLPS